MTMTRPEAGAGRSSAAAHPLRPFLHVADRETDLARRGVVSADPDRAGSLRGGSLAALADRHGARSEYLMAVGSGWGMARLPWRRRAAAAAFNPALCGLAFDGHGFHDAYFAPQKALAGKLRRYRGMAAASYDAGIGRALWFLASGTGEEAVRLVRVFDGARHADLVAGLGLAMGYAGEAQAADWKAVTAGFPQLRPHLLQGLAFAAEAHRRAGTTPAGVTLGAAAAARLPADRLSDIARDLRPAPGTTVPEAGLAAHDGWRRAITDILAELCGDPS